MAKQTGDPIMIKNGKEMLTMAVFAICITAPLGAILIATLGKRWLAYDEEFDTTKDKGEQVADTEGNKSNDVTVEIGAVVPTNNDLLNDDEAPTNKVEVDLGVNKVVPM